MLTKKKKIFIILSMVVLLVVTGYLNIALSSSTSDSLTDSTTTSANFFTSCREDKLSTRNLQIEYLNSIINSSTDSSQITEANAKKMEISNRIEYETTLEGLIMASGFEDVIVTESDSSISVMVKSNGLTSAEVAKILAIIVDETGVEATNVRVIPV
ncbi:MAG: SpoIIIAH-like family protein [Clostridia bacterium]|nr:SpoIIIAH-like family protein [Clostridia bacterium]